MLNKPDLKRSLDSVLVTGSGTDGRGANYGASVSGNLASSSHAFDLRVIGYDRKDSGCFRSTSTGDDHINANRQTGGRVLATWKPTLGNAHHPHREVRGS